MPSRPSEPPFSPLDFDANAPYLPQWTPSSADRAGYAEREGLTPLSTHPQQSTFQTIEIRDASPENISPTRVRKPSTNPSHSSRPTLSSQPGRTTEYQRDRENLRGHCHSFHLDPFALQNGDGLPAGNNQIIESSGPAAHQEVPHLHYFMAAPSSAYLNGQDATAESDSGSSDEDDTSVALRRSESPDFPHVSSWHQNFSHPSRHKTSPAGVPSLESIGSNHRAAQPPAESPLRRTSSQSPGHDPRRGTASPLDTATYTSTPAQSFRQLPLRQSHVQLPTYFPENRGNIPPLAPNIQKEQTRFRPSNSSSSIFRSDPMTSWLGSREDNSGVHTTEPGDPRRGRSDLQTQLIPSSQNGWESYRVPYPTTPVPPSPGVSELPGYQSSNRPYSELRGFYGKHRPD